MKASFFLPGLLLNCTLLSGLLALFVISSCRQSAMDCLPYEGKVVGKAPCGGTLIQVTNRDVSSSYNNGRQSFTNVLGGLVFDGVIDTTLIQPGRTVYFDIRELKPEEAFPCPAIFALPGRRVGITHISSQPCLMN